MPTIKATATCQTRESFRVQQVAGMFDVPLVDRVTESFEVEVPGEEESWDIGLIVGPSASGKSTVAREAFAGRVYQGCEWPEARAVIDAFGDTPTRRIVDLFTAVGFGSPPSWIKPYSALSNGEQFRCDLARSLAVSTEARKEIGRPIVAFDEFTSVVDRNVARICSAAISKAVRRDAAHCRFVAVTCHYDVAEWLEPDWVLDMATGALTRRRLRRRPIELEVHRCRLEAWRLFARHHYLTGSLAPQARCFLATWRGEPVSFAAVLPVIGRKGRRRFSRIVTLPDYQGVGIGMRTVEAVADMHVADGMRINVTSSHPALIGHCRRSALWRAIAVKKTGQSAGRRRSFAGYKNSAGRSVVSFEYVGAQGTCPAGPVIAGEL